MANVKTAEYAVQFENITKRFGSVVANKGVSFGVKKGEVLSLLGENGSGKTTLMNMLSGIYRQDEGEIFVNGKKVVIASPKDAFDLKIGMIHQHFKLVDVFTGVQNIALGLKGEKGEYKKAFKGAFTDKEGNELSRSKFKSFFVGVKNIFAEKKAKSFSLKKIRSNAQAICDKYGFEIDLNKKVYDMSVSEKQTLEIVKVLFRGADFLVLDEPTAVLTLSILRSTFLPTIISVRFFSSVSFVSTTPIYSPFLKTATLSLISITSLSL